MSAPPRLDPALAELLDAFDLDRGAVVDILRLTVEQVVAEVAEVADDLAAGRSPIPEIDHDALADLDTVDRQRIRARGCVLVRGTFERDQALDWDREIAEYLARNGFHAQFADRNPEAAASGSGILPIYWSKPQVAARQHPRMVELRRFLNSLWTHADGEHDWFDPIHDIGYADRLRRRRPGGVARGLPPHCDSPASGGWHVPENHRVFRRVLEGRPDLHDPWDAAGRTGTDVGSTAPAGVFRTFQGWTALSEMHPSDGGLTIAPSLSAVSYHLMKGIAGEIGALGDPVAAPPRLRGDELTAPAVSRPPVIEPGDTIWWHGDLIHGVDEAANDTRWCNLMYVPSSPSCPRNDAYRVHLRAAFERGSSPVDFPAEHYERQYDDRASPTDLGAIGREQFGYDAIAQDAGRI